MQRIRRRPNRLNNVNPRRAVEQDHGGDTCGRAGYRESKRVPEYQPEYFRPRGA